MKKLILFYCLILAILPLEAQNLIPNESFEKLRSLPIKNNPVNNFHHERKSGHKAFTENVNYWFSANGATPDLRVLDAPFQNKCGEQYTDCDTPHSGTYCLGLITHMEGNEIEEYREYIEIKLSKPLRPNVKTYLEFWLRRERQAELISNNFGCYFSKNKVYAPILTPILVTPQFNIDSIINKDGAQWVKIEGSFIPDEAYSFMTMGNFFNNENTKVEGSDAPSSKKVYTSAYYLIDDIKVWQDALPAKKEKIVLNKQEVILDRSFEISAIHFELNKATLQTSSYTVLKELTSLLQKQQHFKLEVHGYTDSSGDADYNMKLSLARAKSIQDYLVGQGISIDRLSIAGHGEMLSKTNLSKKEDQAAQRKVLFKIKRL